MDCLHTLNNLTKETVTLDCVPHSKDYKIKIGIAVEPTDPFTTEIFKINTSSDYTLIDIQTLVEQLGLFIAFLEQCEYLNGHLMAYEESDNENEYQYIDGVSLKFGNIVLENQRVYFTFKHGTGNILGTDILRKFQQFGITDNQFSPQPAKDSKKHYIFFEA